MAIVIKRGKGWAVQIRRKGHPAQFRTFTSKSAAAKWAVGQEAILLSGQSLLAVDRSITLRSLVERYLQTVTPSKRSCETERYRLEKLLRDPISKLSVAKLSTADIAAYRDRRAAEVGAGTIRRELSLLNHMFDLARREWGIPMATNPVSDVTKPRLNNARTRRVKAVEWVALRRALER